MFHALIAATLVALVPLPQDPKPGPLLYPKRGSLILPTSTPAAPAKPTQAGKTPGRDAAVDLLELQRFEATIARLRRGVLQNEGASELELRRIGEEFPEAAGLALRLLKRADADQVPALARVLSRFGKPKPPGYTATSPMGSSSRSARARMRPAPKSSSKPL